MKYTNGHSTSNTGRTWWKKGTTPWNKGKRYFNEKAKTGWSIKCKVCGEKKYYQLNEHKKRERLYCSSKCYHLDSRKFDLKYSSIHSRIRRDWGKAKRCFICGSTSNVDWANISKSYLIARDDWVELCRKHHVAYDTNKIKMVFPSQFGGIC